MKPDDGPTFPLRLVSYTDADFAGDVEDRKSISAGIQFVNGVIARKQTAVALSTAEAEFAGIQQIDNEAASANGKHVDIKLKFLRDYSAKGKMKTDFTDTRTMVADLLTKALPASHVQELCEAIGLVLKH
ncbi:unnamed protein product [Peronospora destructor]|uniref:Uncharacterized protein n=1 Tax=Peronospora destructor TaxID=86335 RepID=A0AAV0TPK7_9STRA|nr:unnamed protein product [Peronospora destructor]